MLEGDRIGVLHADGNAYVKEGPLDAQWTWEGSNVTRLVLDGNHIGVLQTSGVALFKSGALDAAWF